MDSAAHDARIGDVIVDDPERGEKQKCVKRFPRRFERGDRNGDDGDRQRSDQRDELQNAGDDPQKQRVVDADHIKSDGADRADQDTGDQLRARVGSERVIDVVNKGFRPPAPAPARKNLQKRNSKQVRVL